MATRGNKSSHSMPFGAELVEGGVLFRLWAPAANRVDLHVEGRPPLSMESRPEGFYACMAPGVRAGDLYSFSFDGEPLRVADPASRYNPRDVHGASEVIDPEAFDWQDGEWTGRPWPDAVIYELHVGAFTPEGTLAAAEARLGYLAELGVTALELMPVAEAPGDRNWGYDGVLPFAPERRYGRPEDLKRFVQSAHLHGLMVFLDVVYNHFGPEGNYLNRYAPAFFTDKHHTPWGNAINFDDAHSPIVRAFFIHNALYWLNEYRFDGLRLDAVHAIKDDSEPSFLTELAAEVYRLDIGRHKHLVLENGDNGAHYLARGPDSRPISYTAQWNDDFHHTIHVLLTGESGGYYKDYDRPVQRLLRCLTEGFAYQGEPSRHWQGRARGEPSSSLPPEAFVNFLQNHDQIGNRAYGERLWMLSAPAPMRAAETLLLMLPTPILLFMGEEFHAASGFPFFCDFSGDLARAVTDGRRREFADFFSEAELETIPDPNAAATFELARLDWSARERTDGSEPLARYRRLLALRRDRLLPRLPARNPRGRMLAETVVTARWQLADGSSLHLVANMGERAIACREWPGGQLLCSSEPLGNPRAQTLAGWCVVWFLEH